MTSPVHSEHILVSRKVYRHITVFTVNKSSRGQIGKCQQKICDKGKASTNKILCVRLIRLLDLLSSKPSKGRYPRQGKYCTADHCTWR